MIGRADIEGSKSNVAMNAWLPQASYPCGNFSGTSSLEFRGTKGSIGHTFMVCIHTENQNQGDFYPFVLLEISVLHESPLGHLRYLLTDVPPQPNSPPDNVFNPDQPVKDLKAKSKRKSSACVDYVPALCTHRPSLLPIEWLSEISGLALGSWQRLPIAEKLIKLGHLEEVKVVTRFP
nr:hypothetical protein [Tanacetum cinerariifolium]